MQLIVYVAVIVGMIGLMRYARPPRNAGKPAAA